MDKNYQFMSVPPEQNLLDWYADQAVIVNLDSNVRNTEHMINTVEALIHVELGLAQVQGIGNKVTLEFFSSENDLKYLLLNIVDLIFQDNIDQISTVILYQKYDSLIFNMINKLKKHKKSVAEFTSFSECGKYFILYADIWSYRGLEADQVVLILNNASDLTARNLSDIYIGMTRARVNLTILCHSDYIDKLLF